MSGNTEQLSKRLVVRVTPDLAKRIDEVAIGELSNVAAFFRRAILRELELVGAVGPSWPFRGRGDEDDDEKLKKFCAILRGAGLSESDIETSSLASRTDLSRFGPSIRSISYNASRRSRSNLWRLRHGPRYERPSRLSAPGNSPSCAVDCTRTIVPVMSSNLGGVLPQTFIPMQIITNSYMLSRR
jgi:hypothetical protein